MPTYTDNLNYKGAFWPTKVPTFNKQPLSLVYHKPFAIYTLSVWHQFQALYYLQLIPWQSLRVLLLCLSWYLFSLLCSKGLLNLMISTSNNSTKRSQFSMAWLAPPSQFKPILREFSSMPTAVHHASLLHMSILIASLKGNPPCPSTPSMCIGYSSPALWWLQNSWMTCEYLCIIKTLLNFLFFFESNTLQLQVHDSQWWIVKISPLWNFCEIFFSWGQANWHGMEEQI